MTFEQVETLARLTGWTAFVILIPSADKWAAKIVKTK
jgi:hypothetical protein